MATTQRGREPIIGKEVSDPFGVNDPEAIEQLNKIHAQKDTVTDPNSIEGKLAEWHRLKGRRPVTATDRSFLAGDIAKIEQEIIKMGGEVPEGAAEN